MTSGSVLPRRMGVVRVPVVTRDPVGRGHDVDAGLEDGHVEVDVGEHAVEGHAVGLRGDDLVDGAGGDDADGVDADDLTGVTADLVGRVAVQPDQLEVGLVADALDHLAADVAGRDLEHLHPVARTGRGHLVLPPLDVDPVRTPRTVARQHLGVAGAGDEAIPVPDVAAALAPARVVGKELLDGNPRVAT